MHNKFLRGFAVRNRLFCLTLKPEHIIRYDYHSNIVWRLETLHHCKVQHSPDFKVRARSNIGTYWYQRLSNKKVYWNLGWTPLREHSLLVSSGSSRIRANQIKTGSIIQKANPRTHRNLTASQKGTKGSSYCCCWFQNKQRTTLYSAAWWW